MATSNKTTAAQMLQHHELWLLDLSMSQVTSVLQFSKVLSSLISCPIRSLAASHTPLL
jgi:hypothetical protein